MKFSDINAVYTEVVTRWIGQGLTINAGSMQGHQYTMGTEPIGTTTSEITHIDLTDGKDIYRVVMEAFTDKFEEQPTEYGIQIVAGRATGKAKPYSRSSMDADIDNKKLDVIESYRFYEVSDHHSALHIEPFYGTREEAERAEKKRRDGFRGWRSPEVAGPIEKPEVIEIAKRYIARKTGKSRINRDKIRVYKVDSRFDIYYFGKQYSMS